jgi:lipopolysaccharide export system permease protein
MSVLRRLVYREVITAVALVSVAFLGLFFFFDVIDELSAIGQVSPTNPQDVYQLRHALLYVLLQMPNRAYEVLPIAVLIGAVWVFARLAQNSEFTILRTGGLGPWRALRMLLGLGWLFVGLTFVTGDYVAPAAGQAAQLLKARFEGRVNVGPLGAWLKERRPDGTASVNVDSLSDKGDLQGIRIFEYGHNGHVLARTQAASGTIGADNTWQLREVVRTDVSISAGGAPQVVRQEVPVFAWPSALTADMVSVALLRPDRMGTVALYRYIEHLGSTGQSAQTYELQFWRKVFYPLSCLVMLVMALPFAYLHFRSGGITGYVFGGVMIGISFFLLNNVFGYIGRLNDWTPWLAAASPSLIYSVLSLSAFGWLVLRR